MNATTKAKTPALLTVEAEAEVSEALLRYATRNYAGAVLVEHTEAVPPVAPEHVTYRRGALEVEPLGWSAGAAKISQRIDVWAPGTTVPDPATSAPVHLQHATLGKVEKVDRQARLSDGTTVIAGVYTVEAFPALPLIEERTAQAARLALSNRHRQREVGKVGPVEGAPEHRHQRVELGVIVTGSVRPVMDGLRGSNTSAGRISGVEVIGARADHIGTGSFMTATPSYDRTVVQLAVTVEWREK